MEVTFPINKLLDKNLTADDYTIALLIKESKYGLLTKFAKISKGYFFESLKRLKNENYITYNTIGDIIPIKEAKITDKFIDILATGDNFEEFYETYPIKVTRTDGKLDYLRKNKTKCKIKYKKIVKNNLLTHDHIMDCLKLDIEGRQKNNNLAYMKRMENWLDKEEWKTVYEYKLQKDESKELAIKKRANNYGTNLL